MPLELEVAARQACSERVACDNVEPYNQRHQCELSRPAAPGRIAAPLLVPITRNGSIGFQVENAMASVAAAWGLGLDWDIIRAGLASMCADIALRSTGSPALLAVIQRRLISTKIRWRFARERTESDPERHSIRPRFAWADAVPLR